MSGTLRFPLRRFITAALLVAFVSLLAPTAHAQFFRNGAVGGVMIDANGVLSNPQVADMRELQAAWQNGLEQVPQDLNKWTDLRFVSLRQLESQIEQAHQSGKPLPESVRFLAGLQRVKYVLVYPERKDIVLAGPAEGWKVNQLGSVVGATSNRPVLTLDDLMVALRAADGASREGISCSIDPTPEGMRRVAQLPPAGRATQGANSAEQRGQQLAEALGPQTISITGVPATSHFARVIVAADFRMKRLAMDFERAPVDGMPSFLTMLRGGRIHNMMPRWWLAPMYEPLRRDNDGLAWELRGQGVRCLTEQEFLTDAGQKQKADQKEPVAQKWADTFTKKFDDLAREDSAFGELRNVMDLAIVAALMVKEGLVQKSGLEAPSILRDEPIADFPAPRSVPSQASFAKAGRNWIITVSGGVQIFPWEVADRTLVAEELATARQRQRQPDAGWYWQQ